MCANGENVRNIRRIRKILHTVRGRVQPCAAVCSVCKKRGFSGRSDFRDRPEAAGGPPGRSEHSTAHSSQVCAVFGRRRRPNRGSGRVRKKRRKRGRFLRASRRGKTVLSGGRDWRGPCRLPAGTVTKFFGGLAIAESVGGDEGIGFGQSVLCLAE